MTIVAQNVCSYRDVEVDREVVAIDLGHQHYLVLYAGGTSMCEVRRYRDNRLELNNASTLRGGVSLHRVKHLAQLVMKRAHAGAEAIIRGIHPEQHELPKEPKQPPAQLLVDEDLMDKLRDDPTFTASVETALRSAITHAAQVVQARAYVQDFGAAFERAGESGVKMNVAYLVLNLRSWKGTDAQRAKQLLNKWANT
jgi:hypothetical protein